MYGCLFLVDCIFIFDTISLDHFTLKQVFCRNMWTMMLLTHESVLILCSIVIVGSTSSQRKFPLLDSNVDFVTAAGVSQSAPSSIPVELPSSIVLGDSSYTEAHVYNNGLLSFGSKPYTSFDTVTPFPAESEDLALVAPFWQSSWGQNSSTNTYVKYLIASNNKSNDHLHTVDNFFNESSWKQLQYIEWILAVQWIPKDNCKLEDGTCNISDEVVQVVIATDGVASIAVFTYQCISVVEEQDEPLFVIGYSINDTLYQQITFNTTSACLNDSVFYQLNIGIPIITSGPVDAIRLVAESVTFQCAVLSMSQVTSINWFIDDQLVSAIPSHVISTTHEGDVSTSALTINLLSEIDDGRRYKCVASNKQGSVNSTEGQLTINRAPSITTPPTSVTVQEGTQSLTIVCVALIGDPQPTISWVDPNGDQISDQPGIVTVQTYNEVSLLIWASLEYSDSGKYSCVASNLGYGPHKPPIVVTSDFTITVEASPELELLSSSDMAAILGSDITIELRIVKAEPRVSERDIEWSLANATHSSIPITCNEERIQCTYTNNSSLSMVILNVTIDDEGQYTVRVSNSLGTDSETVSIYIRENVQIISSLLPYTLLNESDPLSIQCTASGIPAPVITWSKYIPPLSISTEPPSTTLPYTHTVTTTGPVADSTGVYTVSSILQVPSVHYTDRGIYVCTAVNDEMFRVGFVNNQSTSSVIDIQTVPVLTVESQLIKGTLNGSINITVYVARDNPPVHQNNITWSFNHTVISGTDRHILTNTRRSLSIQQLNINDAGRYIVTAVNAAGQSELAIDVTITDSVKIKTQSTTKLLNESDPLSIQCTASGIPAPVITWSKYIPPLSISTEPPSTTLPYTHTVTTTEPVPDSTGVYTVSSVLQVPSVHYTDRGTYVCTAINSAAHGFSLESSEFPVIIQTKPTIMPHSASIVGLVNTSISLSVSIERDNPPSTIHWAFRDQTITPSAMYSFSEDNRTLTIWLLGYHDEGEYTITASNNAGIVYTVVTVTVFAPVQVSTIPHSQQAVVNQSSNITLVCIGRGRPLPTITWAKVSNEGLLPIENKAFHEGNIGQQYVQSSLMLLNVSEHENGSVFVCTGSSNISMYNITGSRNITGLIANDVSTIQLIVQVAPILKVIGPDEIIVTRYRDSDSAHLKATLTFLITGGVPDYFDFHYSNFITTDNIIVLELNDSTSSSKYTMEWDGSSNVMTIVISNIEYTDEGVYTLHVHNNAGSATVSISLRVKVEAAVISGGPVIIESIQHSSITFSCTADGIPRPGTVVWFRNATLIDTKLFQRVNITEMEVGGFRHADYKGVKSIITIADLDPFTDTALYTCRTGNGVGQPAILSEPKDLRVSKAPLANLCTRLQPCANGGTCFDTETSYYCVCTFDYSGYNCDEAIVSEIPPAIIAPPQNTTSSLYSTVTLTCNATGVPTPRIKWYKDGDLITDHHQHNPNLLIISELSLHNRGFYHCEATSRIDNEMVQIISDVAVVNIIGVVQYRAHLEVQDSSNTTTTTSLDDKESILKLIEEVNEFVAGSIIKGDTSLFFIELVQNLTDDELFRNRYIPIVVTIINSEGGSDELLQAVQIGLSHLNIGITTNVSFLVTHRHDGCEQDVTIIPSIPPNPLLEIRIEWPEVNIGEVAIVACPCGGADTTLKAQRYCGGQFTDGGQWEKGFVAPCNFTSYAREICKITQLPPLERIERIKNITESDLGSTELVIATSVLLTASEDAIGNRNLTEGFFDAVDTFQTISPEVIRGSVNQGNVSARLLEAIELLSESITLPASQTSDSITFDGLMVSVQSLSHDGGINTTKEEEGATYSDSHFNSVYLPRDLIDTATVFDNSTSSAATPKLVLANYNSTALFTRRQPSNLVVHSEIFAASISQRSVENLTNPVTIKIYPRSLTEVNITSLGCYYWDPTLDDGFGDWSQSGCDSNYTQDGQLVCRCNHLTNFAVLLDASPEEVPPVDSIVGQALTAVSYIGVILSIICLLVIIVTYMAARKLRRSEHGKLLLSLCFALLGLYLSFILALHGTDIPAICAIISIILQYFLLVTFFVMASEAINLYMKLVIVLGKGISNYFLKATLISWITPIFIVIFCFAPNYKSYIGNHFCRVHGIQFYVGIIAPFIIVYIFNWSLFIIIMFKLIKKRFKTKYHESASKSQQMTTKQQFMIALTLSLLFGLGWGVGLLSTQSLYTVTAIRDTFSALFILLTAFQGLFLFLMHCVRSKEVRRQWMIWAYKAAGKELPISFLSSTTGFSRSSTIRKTSVRRSTFTRSATLKESTDKMRDFDNDDFVTSHQMRQLEKITDKELESNDYASSPSTADIETVPTITITDTLSSTNDESLDISSITNDTTADDTTADVRRSIVNYPVPSGMTPDGASPPDFHGSQCSIESSGGTPQYYHNPCETKSINHHRISLYSISEPSAKEPHLSSNVSCTNLPNPLDKDSDN